MEIDHVESENNVNTTNNTSSRDENHSKNQNEFQKPEQHAQNANSMIESSPETPFKKPVCIIGPRRGKLGTLRCVKGTESTALAAASDAKNQDKNEIITATEASKCGDIKSIPNLKQQLSLPYKEPSWAGIPNDKYKVEILKSGVILDTINLNDKSFYIIGRLPECDIPLAHPTISRYHAILQYRSVGDEKNGSGYYIYDLESTHGTFWNGCRIKPKHYVRLHGGHMIRFGCSQRKFIFQTPPDEEEKESEYSVTELKEMRKLELLKREQDERERQEEEEKLERMRQEEEEANGIDWGMGEDADEESDAAENPYALTTNEELFLDDPKKTLRGWFEREGFDMQYQTEEKGIGQFLCWIELPIDNITGRPIRAEALVKGKKKESVIQCALEACRILDRQGLLRQATHEGRKRKLRNWEEEDYYDSDEDNFLDRTGTVERKREQRMKNAGKLEEKAETYTSLIEKHSDVVKKITEIQNTLNNHENANKNTTTDDSNEDALDAFMSNLSSALLNKTDIIQMKRQLQHLRKEQESLEKLIDIVKPANLPSLKLPQSIESIDKSTENYMKIFINSNDKHQQLGKKEQRLVPNKGQYGLIKKEELNTVNEAEINKYYDNVDEAQMEISIQPSQSTDNDEKLIKNTGNDTNVKNDESEALKKKKRNLRKMQHRADKVASKIEKTYDENLYKEDYSMWIPPDNQSGDGKTSLNEKLGY
ncbi:hypothetical protein PV327_004983 [Microctonus hyperodae]|uniref:FHA domain-containing protein n=1 Tax=Microctonus hyperodae TaxID=165561 RepID=A0AA39FDL0_MICHY|nr:hypothetical protein PV327_004983 [Microctonus hyperodae]